MHVTVDFGGGVTRDIIVSNAHAIQFVGTDGIEDSVGVDGLVALFLVTDTNTSSNGLVEFLETTPLPEVDEAGEIIGHHGAVLGEGTSDAG